MNRTPLICVYHIFRWTKSTPWATPYSNTSIKNMKMVRNLIQQNIFAAGYFTGFSSDKRITKQNKKRKKNGPTTDWTTEKNSKTENEKISNECERCNQRNDLGKYCIFTTWFETKFMCVVRVRTFTDMHCRYIRHIWCSLENNNNNLKWWCCWC